MKMNAKVIESFLYGVISRLTDEEPALLEELSSALLVSGAAGDPDAADEAAGLAVRDATWSTYAEEGFVARGIALRIGGREFQIGISEVPAIGRQEPDDDACPGCGCEPGDGVTEGCEHPAGCGYWSTVAAGRRS